MKKFILISIVCLFGICSSIYSQALTVEKERFIERSIADEIYVYDTLRHSIHNKDNYICNIEEPSCEFNIKETKPFSDIFDRVFSEKRKEELKGNNLPLIFYCDSLGNVLEMEFRLKDFNILTIKEINSIESLFLKYKFNIINSCPEKKYYRFIHVHKDWN